jgi:hypothetical protein
MRTRIQTTLIALGLVVMTGCALDSSDPTPTADTGGTAEVSEALSVVDGRLVFSSKEAYEATVKHLATPGVSLDAWEAEIPGFTSMRSAYHQAADAAEELESIDALVAAHGRVLAVRGAGDEQEAVMLVEDDTMARLINAEGMLQIGSDVYKVTYDALYRVDAKEASTVEQLRELSGSAPAQTLANVEASKVSRTSQELFARVDECTAEYSSGGTKRLKGETFNTNLGVLYSSAGARSKHQIRRLRIWWRDRTNSLRLQVSGSYTQYFQGIPTGPIPINHDSGWQGDDGREAYTFEFCVNSPCEFVLHAVHATHSAVCDDGHQRSCATYSL